MIRLSINTKSSLIGIKVFSSAYQLFGYMHSVGFLHVCLSLRMKSSSIFKYNFLFMNKLFSSIALKHLKSPH